MKTSQKQNIENDMKDGESGFILILALLMLMLVTIIGIAATRTSETEIRITANDMVIRNDFYSAESVLVDAMERWNEWLTSAFIVSPPGDASYIENVDINGNGTDDTLIEVRFLEPTGVIVPGLSNAANDLPLQEHIIPPPADSGYSMSKFEARRLGITVTSNNAQTMIQAGVWCIFNK